MSCRTLIRLAIFSLALLGAASVSAQDDDHAEHSESFDVKAGQKLEIDLEPGGSVHIEGWDENKAQVNYHERHGKLDAFDIKIEKTRKGLKIHAERNRNIQSSSLHFHIKVPRKFDVDFRTAGGGFELIGVEGKFTGQTGGGGLHFEDAKGEVRMNTGGGGIEVRNCELDGKLNTGGGGVLMKNVVGNLKASSGGGNVEYDNVRSHDGELRGPGGKVPEGGSEETVMITSAGGGIKVKKAPAGASVRTGGGDIEIQAARLFVDASTGGGDIEIEVEDGWVKAATGAGDIEVIIEDGAGEEDRAVHLSSGLGHITLTLPADLSLSFDLDIGYTKNSRKNFKISSEFEFKEKRSEEWDYDNGSPKKHIYGTGKIGDGKHTIRIRTTNGNITILKGD